MKTFQYRNTQWKPRFMSVYNLANGIKNQRVCLRYHWIMVDIYELRRILWSGTIDARYTTKWKNGIKETSFKFRMNVKVIKFAVCTLYQTKQKRRIFYELSFSICLFNQTVYTLKLGIKDHAYLWTEKRKLLQTTLILFAGENIILFVCDPVINATPSCSVYKKKILYLAI